MRIPYVQMQCLVLRLAVLGLLVMASACANTPVDPKPSKTAEPQSSTRMLVLNLATADPACTATGGGVCRMAVEQSVQARVAELDPDVVVFTHIAQPSGCSRGGAVELCAAQTAQIERLLDSTYAMRCGDDGAVCVAVKMAVGEIAGCAEGLCLDLPLADAASGCGPQDAVADINLVLPTGQGINLVVVDLPYTDDINAVTCRAGTLQRLFESSTEVVGAASSAMPVLAVGSFGLDPYAEQDTQASLPADLFHWASYVGTVTEGADAKPYVYLSGIKTGAAVAPPTTTLLPVDRARIDHVISRTVVGACYLLDGTTPVPLAGVSVEAVAAEALTHYGYLCELEAAASEP